MTRMERMGTDHIFSHYGKTITVTRTDLNDPPVDNARDKAPAYR
jgi:hypothetical protein